jgi:hypothetical protein
VEDVIVFCLLGVLQAISHASDVGHGFKVCGKKKNDAIPRRLLPRNLSFFSLHNPERFLAPLGMTRKDIFFHSLLSCDV